MTYGEIVNQIKFEARQQDFTAISTLIGNAVNREYRTAVKRIPFRELLVYNEEFQTESQTVTYTAPYPLLNLVPDGFLFDFQERANTGIPIRVMPSFDMIQQARWIAQSWGPLGVCIRGNIGEALYSTGTITVANGSTAVTGTATAWTTDMEGEWLSPGTGSGAGYGYQIATVSSATAIVLEEAYRGPALATSTYSIRPASTPQIFFAPYFDQANLTCRYTWQRSPRYLYNPTDQPEVEGLSDFLVSKGIAACARYANDTEKYQIFNGMAERQLREIVQSFAS